VDKAQYETDLRYIEIAKKEGCKGIGRGSALTDGKLAKGTFVAPTVFDGVKAGNDIGAGRVFGRVGLMRAK